MKDNIFILVVVIIGLTASFFMTMKIAKTEIREICTYSLNAYPQDSITYYRLGCEVEHF